MAGRFGILSTNRSANHARSELRSKPAETKTSGAVVWVDEDGGNAQKSEVTRDGQGGVAVHLYGSRLQSLSIAKPDGPSMTSDFETGQLIASHAIQITSAPSL
jgi:hypothetical protein